MNRQLVRSEHCTLSIPEYELTIPPAKGQMTTVEGIITDMINDLQIGQPVRMHTDAEVYDKIEALLAKLREIVPEETANDAEPVPLDAPVPMFTLRLDDPTGNSFAEPSAEGLNDPKWSKRTYERSREQDIALGLINPDEEAEQVKPEVTLTDDMEVTKPDEVYSFPSTCNSCRATLETFMKKVNIPHFKVRCFVQAFV